MASTKLDIDLLPLPIALYKKENDNFILAAFNKAASSEGLFYSEKFLGKKITAVIPEVKRSGLFDIMLEVEAGNKLDAIELPFSLKAEQSDLQCSVIKCPDGNIAIFSRSRGLNNSESAKERILKQELSEAEKLLEHQKKMFQHILENSESISVQGYDKDHKVIYWNKGSENLYGYSEKEALGRTLESLIIPEFMREFVYDAIENWQNNGVAVPSSELTLNHKLGHDVNVFSQHVLVEVGVKNHEMYCMDIDLKEVKQLQKELLIQRNFLRTILDSLPDLIWLADNDGKYLACNTMFERFIGAKEKDIIADGLQAIKEVGGSQLSNKQQETTSREVDYVNFADQSYKGLFTTRKTAMLDNEGNHVAVLSIAHDITEHKIREKQLEKYAHFDTLTGLVNRTLFVERLTHLSQRRKKDDFICAVLFIDLDHFKEINDTKGHSIGDEVLILVAKRLKNVLRKGDTLARFGGDEFTVLLEHINSALDVKNVAQTILDILREPFIVEQHEFYLTTSVGITIYPEDGQTPESLLRFADIAMYKAKALGRDNYQFYTEALSKQAAARVLLENNLRRAVQNNEFILYYQPQVDARNKKIIGAEALIRWNDPDKGLISPAEFIAVAELSGQIIDIGRWVLHQAMIDMSHWKSAGFDIETISINLSVKQLNDKSLISSIKKALNETQCSPKWIEFEVTEGYAMNEPEQAIILLNKITDLGCKLSLDDFGTGYSSLAYLKRLPVKKLKIDQSFIRDIPGDSDDEAIVNAVILIAQSMQLEVIAEGVEEEVQQAFLLQQNCQYSQGYLYAKPMPIEQFEKFMAQKK